MKAYLAREHPQAVVHTPKVCAKNSFVLLVSPLGKLTHRMMFFLFLFLPSRLDLVRSFTCLAFVRTSTPLVARCCGVCHRSTRKCTPFALSMVVYRDPDFFKELFSLLFTSNHQLFSSNL